MSRILVADGLKLCSRCKQAKPVDCYDKDKYQNTGLSPQCKLCRKETRGHYVASEDYKKAHLAANKSYKLTTKGQLAQLKYTLKKKYSLSLKQYAGMYERQRGQCAICGRVSSFPTRGTTGMLAVDHDHSTGKVRGLLCTKCNTLLGMADDCVVTLDLAIEYLQGRT